MIIHYHSNFIQLHGCTIGCLMLEYVISYTFIVFNSKSNKLEIDYCLFFVCLFWFWFWFCVVWCGVVKCRVDPNQTKPDTRVKVTKREDIHQPEVVAEQ